MNLFVPAFRGFFKNKKIKFHIVTFSLTFGIVISILYSLYSLNIVLSEKIENNIINRVIVVNRIEKELSVSNVMKCDNVEIVYKRLQPFGMNINEKYNLTIKYVLQDELPKIINGSIFSDIKEAQIILPDKIVDNQNNMICFEDYIGKETYLSVNDFVIGAKVCGIYKAKNYETTMYINEIFKEKLLNYNSLLEENRSIYVVADNYKNVDGIIKELKSKGYSANISDIRGQADIKLYNSAKIIMIAVLCLMILFMYVSITIIINQIIFDERLDIAILKSLGYKLKDILKILKYRIITILFISILFGIIVSLFMNKLINNLITKKLSIVIYNSFNVYCQFLLIFSIVIYIIAKITIVLNNSKIRKINIIELLKEN